MELTAEQVRERLRLAMTRDGFNQDALATRIGITRQLVSLVLLGRQPPAGKILNYLGLERVVLYREMKSERATRRGIRGERLAKIRAICRGDSVSEKSEATARAGGLRGKRFVGLTVKAET